MKEKRILLKLSGEALAGDKHTGLMRLRFLKLHDRSKLSMMTEQRLVLL